MGQSRPQRSLPRPHAAIKNQDHVTRVSFTFHGALEPALRVLATLDRVARAKLRPPPKASRSDIEATPPLRQGHYSQQRIPLERMIHEGSIAWDLHEHRDTWAAIGRMMGVSAQTAWRRGKWFADYQRQAEVGIPSRSFKRPRQRNTKQIRRGNPWLMGVDGRRRRPAANPRPASRAGWGSTVYGTRRCRSCRETYGDVHPVCPHCGTAP